MENVSPVYQLPRDGIYRFQEERKVGEAIGPWGRGPWVLIGRGGVVWPSKRPGNWMFMTIVVQHLPGAAAREHKTVWRGAVPIAGQNPGPPPLLLPPTCRGLIEINPEIDPPVYRGSVRYARSYAFANVEGPRTSRPWPETEPYGTLTRAGLHSLEFWAPAVSLV